MSRLSIFPDESAAHAPNGPMPALESDDPVMIQAELSRRGIGFEQWPAEQGLPEGADQATILQAYADAIARVQRCLLYTSPSPRDKRQSRMPSSA